VPNEPKGVLVCGRADDGSPVLLGWITAEQGATVDGNPRLSRSGGIEKGRKVNPHNVPAIQMSVKKDRELDRAAVAELAIGVLGSKWVKATDLAELVGVSVQQLHASLRGPLRKKILVEKIVDFPVGKKHGKLPRAFYKRAGRQASKLPDWLSPVVVPGGGSLRTISFLTDDDCCDAD
jgi:hypothetical protein